MSDILHRFCNWCGLPSEQWPDPRRAWRSPFCTGEHRSCHIAEKRKRKKTCRLCGRGMGRAQMRFVAEKNVIDKLRSAAKKVKNERIEGDCATAANA